jgi:hypothetical protein
MRRVGWCALVLGLAVQAHGQDPPKDDKKPTAKQQYDALVKEFNAARSKLVPQINKAKGEEQQKLLDEYMSYGKQYAEKFYKLAEDEPKDPAATDALFWVVQNGSGSPVHQKAAEKVATLVREMPLKDLTRHLATLRGAPESVMEAALKRAEKDEADPQTADLLAAVVMSNPYQSIAKKAAERLLEKHPDNAAAERVVSLLGRLPDGADTLKRVLEKATQPRLKAAAALALGQSLVSQTERPNLSPADAEKLGAEAEKYMTMAIELYGKEKADAQKGEAERELKAFQTLRVGKEAPEIRAADLDGKEFKLSDYRGKVVLLDFWGDW